jgi:hypothetical protein
MKKLLMVLLSVLIVCLVVALLLGRAAMIALAVGFIGGWIFRAVKEGVRSRLSATLRRGREVASWIFTGDRALTLKAAAGAEPTTADAARSGPSEKEERLDPDHGGVGQRPRDTAAGLDTEKFNVQPARSG